MGNKQVAIDMLHMIVGGKAHEAFDRYVAEGLRHHNPWFKGDRNSLLTAMAEDAERNPDKVLEVQHALEDGEMVAVHSRLRARPGDGGLAVVHLFRFEGERVIEMWDVVMMPPDDVVNENGIF